MLRVTGRPWKLDDQLGTQVSSRGWPVAGGNRGMLLRRNYWRLSAMSVISTSQFSSTVELVVHVSTVWCGHTAVALTQFNCTASGGGGVCLLSRRSRQRERLSASMLSICSFVCLLVCLSVCRQDAKNAIFSKKLSNLELWCLLTSYRKSAPCDICLKVRRILLTYMGFSKNPLLDP